MRDNSGENGAAVPTCEGGTLAQTRTSDQQSVAWKAYYRHTAMLQRAQEHSIAGGCSLFKDLGSTRIDIACPHCQQLFKVRLRKLQFGSDLVCRLCRHEFATREVAGQPEVQEALAHMQRIVKQRVRGSPPHRDRSRLKLPAVDPQEYDKAVPNPSAMDQPTEVMAKLFLPIPAAKRRTL